MNVCLSEVVVGSAICSGSKIKDARVIFGILHPS